MIKNIGKNVSRNLSNKYSQKLMDHAKQSAVNPLKTTSKRASQKSGETNYDLIGSEIADKIMRTTTKNA